MLRGMTIALVLIVRDEALTLPRLLASVREHIDTWTIIDTGSTDDTISVVRRELDGIPGQLLEREWVDFGTNRTQAVEAAYDTADYLLLMDADWTLNAAPGALEGLTGDAYNVEHVDEAMSFWNTRLVSGRIRWRYEGVVHEHLASDEAYTVQRIDGVTITNHCDGGSRAGRHERDLQLLATRLAEHPSDARAAYYYAQTLECLGRTVEAATAYEHRASMPGFDEETYHALYRAGVLRDDITLLLRAWSYRPMRLEALYEAAHRLRAQGAHEAVYALIGAVAGRGVSTDLLFVEPWIYQYGLHFELALACQHTGRADQAALLYAGLLTQDLPPAYRDAVHANQETL